MMYVGNLERCGLENFTKKKVLNMKGDPLRISFTFLPLEHKNVIKNQIFLKNWYILNTKFAKYIQDLLHT